MTTTPAPLRNEHLSASRLKRYAQCPMSYELHYLDGRPSRPNPSLQFGTVLHEALEETYGEVEAGGPGRFPVESLVAAYRDAWARSGLGDFALFEEGLGIVRAYARQHPLVDPQTVLAVEQEFRLPVGRFEVLGYMDRVDRLTAETVMVVDYKSNRTVFSRDEVDHDLQLSIYAMAARQLWPWAKTVRLGFYLLRHGFLMETVRTEEQLEAAREYIALFGEQMESAERFPARLNENCVWCDHTDDCPAYHRARLGRVEFVAEDESDLEAVAREREAVARTAKVLYARKDVLERILRAQLREVGRLELGGMVYTLGTTTQLSYPTEPTLAVLREVLGKTDEELAPALLVIDRGRLDAFLKGLGDSVAPADVRLLKARLEALADKSVSPRFNARQAAPAPITEVAG